MPYSEKVAGDAPIRTGEIPLYSSHETHRKEKEQMAQGGIL
jgi:hypothetical protein